jgi:hypothetical protein
MPILELTAVRVQPGDFDLEKVLVRVQDLEGQPVDGATWASMVELARIADLLASQEWDHGL